VNYPDATSWYAIFAPKGTPKEIVAKINADLEHVLALPDVKSLEDKLGFITIGGTPEKLAAYLQSEIKRWTVIAKDPLFEGK
jgi:tripartite-type tricarboxylate transporter receptor subunit TctC